MKENGKTEPAWTFEGVFPLVVDAILAAPVDKYGWRSTSSLVDTLAALPQAKETIASALSTNPGKNERHLASNMVAWFAAEMTKGTYWPSRITRIGAQSSYRYRVLSPEEAYPGEDPDFAAIEATPHLVQHLERERAPGISKLKKDHSRLSDGSLTCESCNSNSRRLFPQLEGDLWEVHHRLPIGTAKAPVETKLADLAILCPTCHRAIHRTTPMLSVEQFRQAFFT